MKAMDLDQTKSDLIIGIDLGTTNSAVAVYSTTNVPTLCPMGVGKKYTMQSCVRWDGGDEFTVGEEAYKQRYLPNVCYSIKRHMGTDFRYTFELPTGETKTMTPTEISAEILKALKSCVNEYYPGVYRCVITVPAYFNQRQIEDTVNAAKLAKLECVQILKEPTSASYIYSTLGYARDGSVLIYDLGGGTFDITHMSFLKKSSIPQKVMTSLKRQYGIDMKAMEDESSLYYCKVLGTYGDTALGGDDVDAEFARVVWEREGSPKLSESEFEELTLKCEQFKKMSSSKAGTMTVTSTEEKVGDHIFKLTDEDLKAAVKVIFQKTMAIVEQIDAAELQRIKTIVLVGGSTKSAHLVDMLQKTFPDKEISRVLDPDATVALGAGAVAKDIDEGRSLAYQDVLPMAIGVLVDESKIEHCIKKNTSLPYSRNVTYYTMHDDQTAVSVDIYQGNSTVPSECTYLGRLRVDDIPPAKAGEIAVTIAFLLSAQGRLKIVTTVAGVNKPAELAIDSIFNVSTEDTKPVYLDEFEESMMAVLFDNREAVELLQKRREAILAGREAEASEYEFAIVELL